MVVDLRFVFKCYCLWFKAVGFRLSWIFFFVSFSRPQPNGLLTKPIRARGIIVNFAASIAFISASDILLNFFYWFILIYAV